MSTLADLTAQLAHGRDLSAVQIENVAVALAGTDESDASKGEFLLALGRKGESAAELAGFAKAFRSRAINPGVEAWADRAIDIVGTGGDHAGGFNVSSLVVLVLASAGVVVMKHGNRGITSKCGSADLLAALGVKLDAPPETLRRALQELGFVFFFAPSYHPTFKHIAPVRKALAAQGHRTIFNILGPLINPGRPAHVVLGTFSGGSVPKLADALEALGSKSGLAVHGVIDSERGIDELTTATSNRVRGFGALREVDGLWDAGDFGLERSPFSQLLGGDLPTNLALVEAILSGRGPAGLVDTIVLNAAVAMWVVGQTPSVQAGLGPARDLLLGGAVKKKISATREFYRS
ncbi:anthranilate phosphoribosyltransferase [Horticoccus sp. 23ND18S-11]|uniref:anthranilate phosphoribosyltransferase n=1 Tax=Horticoccus sp. 23ND18S-11 TaxID=3391832 RepID=UPI0039C8C29E